MKKRIVAILIAVGVVIAGVVGVCLIAKRDAEPRGEENFEKFALSEEMYDKGEFVDITAEQYDQLVAEKKSFVVVLHMVICPAEFPVKDSAKQLAREDGMMIYSLTEEEFKKTNLAEKIKYLPSVALIDKGELVDFLDAEADKDVQYYKTAAELKKWIAKRVKR